MPEHVVVVGASRAGISAARELRRSGYSGRLTLVDAEDEPSPYERYPLSKGSAVRTIELSQIAIPVEDLDACWLRGPSVRAAAVDGPGEQVVLESGRRVEFSGLVIATGARPHLPPWAPLGCPNVMVMRTLADARRLRSAAVRGVGPVVVVGGGLLGHEVACQLSSAGVGVTMVNSESDRLAGLLGPFFSDLVRVRQRVDGISVIRQRVSGVAMRGRRVVAVELAAGADLQAGLVVLAMGTRPNSGWVPQRWTNPLGISCDENLFVVDSGNAVAAGDVASVPHPLLSGARLAGSHWFTALTQGRLAARNLLVGRSAAQPFTRLPTFGTKLHGLELRSTGFPELAHDIRPILREGEKLIEGFFDAHGQLIGSVSTRAATCEADHLRKAMWQNVFMRSRASHLEPSASLPTLPTHR